MINLIKISISILLLSFIFSNSLGFGSGLKVQLINDTTIYHILSVQFHNYKPDNFYQSYRIDFSRSMIGSGFSRSLNLSTSYGKYYRKKFLQLSYGLGVCIDYFQKQNRLGFYFPFYSEFTIILKDKIGLSIGGMVYPSFFNQSDNNGRVGLGFGFNGSLKILSKEKK